MANEQILIVDDDPQVLGLLAQFLKEDGYRPLVAACAMDSLPIIRRENPAVILLDVRLPDANGVEFLTQQLLPELGEHRVIVMSGDATRDEAQTAVQNGAYDFLMKPIDMSRLRITIRNCVRMHELAVEVTALTGRTAQSASLWNIVGTSPQVVALIERIKQVAPFDAPVLILGENGTGKELVARAIHTLSPRYKHPYVPMDCAALPETLVESEIFGHERGAFSGAIQSKAGKLEQANGGTLLLDEIANIPLSIQPKLLRVLQSKVVDRLGGQHPVPVDVRILSATNADMEQMVAGGGFRRDLYHRLNTVVLMVPPLRERVGDISLLANYALMMAVRAYKKPVRGISPDAMAVLEAYRWPGNVRELENCMRSAVIMADQLVEIQHLPPQICEKDAEPEMASVPVTSPELDVRPGESLSQIRRRAADQAERAVILRVLDDTGWNKAEAARRFGIDYKTLYVKIRSLAIQTPVPL
jgi:DNA-binding NtrC family response regulator